MSSSIPTKNENIDQQPVRDDMAMNESSKATHNLMQGSTTNAGAMGDASTHAAGGLIDTGSNQNQQNAAMADDSMPTSVEDDQNYQFYKEYCRLYYANIILTNRLQQLLNEKKDLQFKLSRLESNRQAHEEALGMTFDITDERRKRHRRTANEIQRHYVCPVEDCPKSYGSEGSLNQHLKIKHPEFYQAQIQASNAQQHIVSGVISQAANGQRVVGLPANLSGVITSSMEEERQKQVADDDDDEDDEEDDADEDDAPGASQ